MSTRNWARVALVLWLSQAPANAQEEESLERELEEEFELLSWQEEEVVFSAARHRQKKQLSPSTITVITRSQIESSGAFSLVDLLRRVPGMEVIVVSPGFSSVNARIPTTLENHLFLVLVDGRRTNIWFWGQAAWELQPFSLDDIERIEIIRGPASAIYGANAVGGVISITTRAVPEKPTAAVQFEGGSWSRVDAAGRFSAQVGELGFSAGAGYGYAGDFGDQRLAGKEILKGRGLLEYRPGEDLLLRLDVSGGEGHSILPTVIGRLDGTQDVFASGVLFGLGELLAQANYTYSHFLTADRIPLELNGLRLAELEPIDAALHDLEIQGQWTLPGWWEALALILGGDLRFSWLACPNCLDGKGFTDPASEHYHRPGTDYAELGAGFFLHGELYLWERLMLSLGGRFDYHSDSGYFISPRLAAVVEALPEHYVRFSAGRAFRKLTYLERHLHPLVTFPEGSPLQGGDRLLFLEFMSRVIGNEQLPDETLWAFELGYQWTPALLGLEVDLCAYLNIYGHQSAVHTDIRLDSRGLPDLRNSTARYQLDKDFWIAGVEASFKYALLDWLTLRGAWSYRYIVSVPGAEKDPHSADHLYSLGAEFHSPEGFIGSLFVSGRSSLLDESIDNPQGLLEPSLAMRLPASLLMLARLGYRIDYRAWQVESGVKVMLPLDLETGNPSYYEHGGGVTPEGRRFGGTKLRFSLLYYLQGSF